MKMKKRHIICSVLALSIIATPMTSFAETSEAQMLKKLNNNVVMLHSEIKKTNAEVKKSNCAAAQGGAVAGGGFGGTGGAVAGAAAVTLITGAACTVGAVFSFGLSCLLAVATGTIFGAAVGSAAGSEAGSLFC